MIVILLALVLTAANSDTVRTSVSTGTPLIVNQVHQSGELYESQSFWFRFEDVPFEFSSEVFERDNPLETGVHEDYESNLARNTETYKVRNCVKHSPQIYVASSALALNSPR